MTGTLQPLSQQFPIVDADGKPTLYFTKWAQQRQIDIEGSVSAAQAAEIVQQFLDDHQLQAGAGISITPNGSVASSPTISAQVQGILNQLSSTQGAVAFRGPTDWQALAPGTAGQVLQSGGAGANPSWASGGGGSITVEQNGTAVVSGATTLNFTGGVTVTDAGSGEAIINISGGGGGVPTIVQKKIGAFSNIAAGITLDAPPANGNILVAVVFNATNAGTPTASAGWTVLESNTTVPDHASLWKRAGPTETATQVPTSQVDGGAIALYEITGTLPVNTAANIATAASVNVTFSTNAFFSTSAGVLLTYSGRRTTQTGAFVGSTPTDLTVAGASATTGGTGVSMVTGIGTLVVAGNPASTANWPTSDATKAGYVLIA